MPVSDGFGESHALDDYLREQEGLLQYKASRDQDAVQEARVAVWLTLAKHPQATRSYLDQAASWRIISHLRGEAQTGESRTLHGPHKQPEPSFTTEDVATELAAPDALEAANLAYHQGEIMRAIAELPQVHREYVVLRFWGDLSRDEIGRALRRNPGNLATTWKHQIQPQLAKSLAHLAL